MNWSDFVDKHLKRLELLRSYNIDDLFNDIDADGLCQDPVFSYLSSDLFEDYSIIFGGGLSPANCSRIYDEYSAKFKSLSFSFSNYFYQKELANKTI